MTITILQHDIQWNDATANMHTVDTILHSHQLSNQGVRPLDSGVDAKSDLIILPEMWNTGFITNPQETHIASPQTSLTFMQKWAKTFDAAVVGSMATNENGKYYNRLYFVKPDGSYDTYDKRHLFSYADEDKHYTPGTKPLVVEWRGVRIMLQVCYDLRFPVFSRNNKSNPYDLCVYVASWPESRRRVWDTLLQSRAIENQCFVVGVNRIGYDSNCKYNGGTQLVDAYGKVVAIAKDDEPCVITETLDLEKLERFRKKFPVLRDAD